MVIDIIDLGELDMLISYD
jgi:hypothetical protein